MFEALSWRRSPYRAEAVVHYAADSLAHAGRSPVVLGSLAALALLGAFARIGLKRRWLKRRWLDRTWNGINDGIFGRARATVIPARARGSAEKAMPINGRRRRKRRRKAASRA